MSAAGLELCFLRANVTAVYQEVLEHFLLPTAEQLFGSDEFTFQHDQREIHPDVWIRGLPRMGHRSCLGRKPSVFISHRKFPEKNIIEDSC